MNLKGFGGEELILTATATAIEISKGLSGDEVLALSDFFGAITANLIAIADRRIYQETQEQQKKQQE